MTTTLTAPSFSPESTLGELVVAHPVLARVFARLQLDYCCGGRQTLLTACAQRGLELGQVIAQLQAELAEASAPDDIDPTTLSLTQLADHIEQTHHHYLKEELPRLVEMAVRVANRHGDKDARLAEVAKVTTELAEEMLCHMQKEELILFPLVRQIDAARDRPVASLITGPIAQMEEEHQAAGDATSQLSLLTGGFDVGSAICNTHRALLDGLARFQADLHRHVHKENNVLFPRALQHAATAGTRSA